ncbi:MAG: MCP four helix bundle domain-containing protein [Bacteroidetes bacterium]|nr:MCP four helix bundle domain-containing protein [Bacteroidota bacterium]
MNASKWALSTRKKLQLMLVMVLIAGMFFIAKVYEKEQVADIDQSFLSIYEDRLVPAVSIFEIRELLYRKRELLREMLPADNTLLLRQKIDSCNQAIATLLDEYKKTFFQGNETDYLKAFESNLHAYDRFEQAALQQAQAGHAAVAMQQLDTQAAPHFKSAVLKLSELNHIQSEIGKGMLSDSKKSMASYLVLSNLETALIVLFSVLAHILIYATQSIIRRKMEPFNMN